jgi:ribosomal protein L7/L12
MIPTPEQAAAEARIRATALREAARLMFDRGHFEEAAILADQALDELLVNREATYRARILEVARGDKITAIKQVRADRGLSLKDAKDYVDALLTPTPE